LKFSRRPCHFVDVMVWAAVEEATLGGTAHGAAVDPVPVADSGNGSERPILK
jgi:hypothetical protein